MTAPFNPRQTGFTLIELIVVLVIVAISLTIALPSFNEAMIRNRLASQSNEFIAAVNLARTASLELNAGGGVCAANATRTDCGGSWANGWLVWADRNRNNAVNPNEILAVGRFSDKDVVTGTGDIRFDGRGRRVLPVPGVGDSLIDMRPVSCSSGQEYIRSMTISALGSVSVTKGSC